MQTNPLYLTDPYQTEMDATVIEVLEDRVILDQTVFYPMGGGQPTDQGFLIFSDGTKGEVFQVLLKEGEINHYLKGARIPSAGEKVKGVINWERRFKNMRVHSAGHVIDFALFVLGYSPSLLHPMKADHGKKPFIVYSGTLDKDIKLELQAKVDEFIQKNMKFSWTFEPLEQLEKEALYLQPGLPKNKPLRALRLEGVGAVADGGTIVGTTGEIGPITISSIETKDGQTFIHYFVVA